MTALREAHQVGALQPTTLVSYDADIGAVVDFSDPAALAAAGWTMAALSDPSWREQMKAKGEAPTQGLARQILDAGGHGLLVRSFAPGAGPADLNLVLWRWGDQPPTRLELIDSEGRLSR